MEKFIFLFRGGTGQEDWSNWIEDLKQKGAYLEGAPLIRDGRIVEQSGQKVKDFIFDIEENARGFAILQAANIEGAIKLSEGCPVFSNGGNVTIRPIHEEF